MSTRRFRVIVVGGGHAGVEAAWAAASLLPEPGAIALVTLDPRKIGVMSCNPAIGGLAKGQLVREIDALGGLMGLAADATGIMFKALNTSRGPAVRGPRCQSDKHAYAETVQALVASRRQIEVIAGAVERLLVERVPGCTDRRITGVDVAPAPTSPTREQGSRATSLSAPTRLLADAVVITTGTFMRGLMHTGQARTPGGRHGEAPASALSAALESLGFELGRLKTGTCPRLQRASLDWDALPEQAGDAEPMPFSDLTPAGWSAEPAPAPPSSSPERRRRVGAPLALGAFPRLPQIPCRQTRTTPEAHELIRANLHRAPMFSGQIESAGPRYCPSIEDKVVRFAGRESHGVFLEPESHRDDTVYCNGISTSLPEDVQDVIVRTMPGCEKARIVRHGYAVEYDMVRPHQIRATGETKPVAGLFLAGQINGTSGYEEAAAQGLVAGVNAARRARGEGDFVLGRDQAYIGVLMDDLVTKTPREPYRMFTSRAEHRLILRADNAPDRLTPIARDLGLLASTKLGAQRGRLFEARREAVGRLDAEIDKARLDGEPLARAIRRPGFGVADLRRALPSVRLDPAIERGVWETVHAERVYEPYIARERAQIRRQSELERWRLPAWVEYEGLPGLRAEAAEALARFRPETYAQAGRLEGVTPADLNLLSVLIARGPGGAGAEAAHAGASSATIPACRTPP